MKKIVFLILLLTFLPVSSLALSCSISTTCSGVTVFKISSLTNAHAELPTQTNYDYHVCCNEEGLGNSCSEASSIVVLKLYSATNSHVEKNSYTNYPYSVCLSISSGTINCQYKDECDSNFVCLASISSSTNAHVGDCNAYPIKICCNVTLGPPICEKYDPEVEIIPQTQPTDTPGDTLIYKIEVENRDRNCESSKFQLKVDCPSEDWDCSLEKDLLEIPAGNTGETILDITSPLSASIQKYEFTVTATNITDDQIYSGQKNGYYNIVLSALNFKVWLGIDELKSTVGEAFPVSIYVQNLGSEADSYTFSIISSSNVNTKLYEKQISNVLPGSIVSTKVEITPIRVISQETVRITVASSSGGLRSVVLKISSGNSNLPDLDIFSIILLIAICLLIFIKLTKSYSI